MADLDDEIKRLTAERDELREKLEMVRRSVDAQFATGSEPKKTLIRIRGFLREWVKAQK